MTLGDWRSIRAMSQQELADRVGVTLTTVYRWERGQERPRARRIRRLATVLRLSLDEIQEALTLARDSFLRNQIEEGAGD